MREWAGRERDRLEGVLPRESQAMPAPRSPWVDALRRLARNRLALAGGLTIVLLGLLALFAPLLAPYDYARQDYDVILRGPSPSHWFGTDALGRDVFSRALYGARISLTVGIVAQGIVVVLGLTVGVLASVGGRVVDNLLMRLTDVAYAFPDLLLIILLRAVFGGSLLMILLAIALVNWTTVARLVRGQILSLKQQDFAMAARALGAGERRIVVRHLLPNALGPVIVAAAFGVPRAIFAEAALSFIGIGVSPPTPSWGAMVQDGYQAIFAFPHLVIFPALAIALVMMAFTFLGDGLRDALDPRHS
jgi:oligopeptide transport system permease protein